MADTTITLGGQTYKVRPLTIAQLEALESVVERLGKGQGTIKTARQIVEAALARDHKTVKLDDLESTPDELIAASNAVMEISGYVKKDPKPGESQAAPPTGQA